MADDNRKAEQDGGDSDAVDTGDSLLDLFDACQEDICEWGDVVLVANDDYHPPLKLRVSSCILAMVSKPFKALFSKKYAEGRQRSHGNECEIQVKDAPVPLKRLCLLLHHRSPYEEDETHISSSAMLELALIADKYDCHQALRLSTDALLAKYERKQHGEWHECLEHLLAAAFMLDHLTHFRRFCREIVLNAVMLSPNHCETRCLDVLPSTLLSSLQMQQSIARQELSMRVTLLVERFSEAAEKAGRGQLIVMLLDSLKQQHRGLWPLNFTSHSLVAMTRAFKQVKVPIIITGTAAPKPPDPDFDWAQWGSVATKKKKKKKGEAAGDEVDQSRIRSLYHDALTEGSETVRNLAVGVCLDCIKERPCRQSHRSHFRDSVEREDSDQSSLASFDEDEWDFYHQTNHPGYWEEVWVRMQLPMH